MYVYIYTYIYTYIQYTRILLDIRETIGAFSILSSYPSIIEGSLKVSFDHVVLHVITSMH